MPKSTQSPAPAPLPRSLFGSERALRSTSVCCTVLACCLCVSCAPGPWRFHQTEPPPLGFRQVPIGIGEDYPKEARSPGRVRRDLELLKANGLTLLRVSFPWDAIEYAPGKYDWGFWDQLVTLAVDQYHFRLVPYICYTPRWASSSTGDDFWHQPPKDNARFGEFVGRLVERYRGRIASWEIWNEPDNPAYWLGTPEQFAALLRAGTHAARKADPDATIVMGGLAWNLNFLEAMLTNRVTLDDVNVINLHNYNETWSEEPLERLPAYLGRADDLLRTHGRNLPLWMAEVGYSSFRRGAEVSPQFRAYYRYEHTPEQEGASVFKVLSMLLASGKVSLITWYRLNDLPAGQEVIGDENNRYLGVVDAQGRPKPALEALRYFHSLFAGGFRCLDDQVRAVRKLDSHAETHVFERPDGSLIACVWLPTVVAGTRHAVPEGQAVDTRREKVELQLPFQLEPEGELFDVLGRSKGAVPCVREGEGTAVTLEVPGNRVLVVSLQRASRFASGNLRTAKRSE